MHSLTYMYVVMCLIPRKIFSINFSIDLIPLVRSLLKVLLKDMPLAEQPLLFMLNTSAEETMAQSTRRSM